jgi:glycosyltransferase involved in cell wall biosynthesis
MKIGFYYVSPFPTVGADIVHIVQMCRTTAQLGHEVLLFVPRSAALATDNEAMVEAGKLFGEPLGFRVVFVKRLTLFGRLNSLGSVISAWRAFRREKLDLIHNLSPWACAALPSLSVPFLFEVHEIDFHRSRLITKFLQRSIVWSSHSRWCRSIVAISHALRQRWADLGVPEEKLMVAHDAVNMALFEERLTKQDARARLGIGPSGSVVVYTGALFEYYGIEMILEAAREFPNVRFYIVGGEAADVERCRRQAASFELKNMIFTGRVPHRDIPTWQAAADILLMQWSWRVPTMAVCSPMKMFEYMAAERLIVGPAFPTIEEVLKDGEDAVLFEPDNLQAMIGALKRALSLCDATDMPAVARRKVASEYTWQERCRKILAMATS